MRIVRRRPAGGPELGAREAPRQEPPAKESRSNLGLESGRGERGHRRSLITPRAEEVRPGRARPRPRAGVLEDVRQIADGAHEHGIRRLGHSPIHRRVFEPGAHHPHVLQPELASRPLEEARLLLARLEQNDGGFRPGDGERDSREARATPDVERGSRWRIEECDRIERVEDVPRVDRGTIPIGDQGERSRGIVDKASVALEEAEGFGCDQRTPAAIAARPARPRGAGTERRLKLAVVSLQIRRQVARRRGGVRAPHIW